MQCTPAEIAEKRRQAQLKLQKKNLITSINTSNSNKIKFGINSPNSSKQANFNSYTSPKFSAVNKTSYNQGATKSPANAWKSNLFNTKPYEKPKQVAQFYGNQSVIRGTCALISEDRFAVDLSGYSAPAIDIFKTIPSRVYNSKSKVWDFHVNDYEMLQNKLTVLQPDVVVGRLPHYVIQCYELPKPDYSKIDLSSIDRELLTALMPFQVEGVCFGIDKKGRCLIADEMGLGKTFQALAIACYYSADWPMLIVTTASMKNVWEETIHKYMPSVSIMHTQYMVSGRDYIGDAKILIVSYDMMSRSLEKLLDRKFGVLLIDESHTLKNFKAKCTKAAIELAKGAKRIVLLSGTPALSRPSELYTQLTLLDEKFFGNFFEYSRRYCDAKTTNFGWDATGKSNLQELEVILAKKFMIRRTKELVLKSLPDKEQEIVTLDVHLDQLSAEDRKCLNALAANYNRQKKAHDKQVALLTFFSETARIKIPSVCSYILQTLDHSRKFIVFAHHKKMLDAVERVLSKMKLKYIRIDGSTSSDQRKYFVDKFQLDDNYVCAILSITAANAGITLTAARLVIFAELHWNPSILSQAESRAHRIGQEGKVIVKYLLAPGTADDSIWPMLQEKQKILTEAGLCKDSFNNVAITKQQLSDKEPIAECLNSTITSAGTLNITHYFKSPSKSNHDENCSMTSANTLDITSYFNKSPIKNVDGTSSNKENTSFSENISIGDSNFNASGAEMDFLNDEFDDMLSNVELNI